DELYDFAVRNLPLELDYEGKTLVRKLEKTVMPAGDDPSGASYVKVTYSDGRLSDGRDAFFMAEARFFTSNGLPNVASEIESFYKRLEANRKLLGGGVQHVEIKQSRDPRTGSNLVGRCGVCRAEAGRCSHTLGVLKNATFSPTTGGGAALVGPDGQRIPTLSDRVD